MLGKLIKYDLKYGVKMFLLLHVMLLTSCTAGRLIIMNQIDFSSDSRRVVTTLVLIITVFTIIFSAAVFGTSLLYAARFYKNLFTDEGYLSWTIPATPLSQLLAKVASAFIWHLLSTALSGIGIVILVTGHNTMEACSKLSIEFYDTFGITPGKLCAVMLILIILNSFASIAMVYLSIALGQLMPGHRVLCSVVSYFILYLCLQIFTLVGMMIMGLLPVAGYSQIATGIQFAFYFRCTIFLSIILILLMSALGYTGTYLIMKKKLNLV